MAIFNRFFVCLPEGNQSGFVHIYQFRVHIDDPIPPIIKHLLNRPKYVEMPYQTMVSGVLNIGFWDFSGFGFVDPIEFYDVVCAPKKNALWGLRY